ncbi:MAG: CPBP family intramembrane metalloprotease, partial [Chlamydiae bacterium]|nr:CPBP family intramembrane metalloprotease [Chlamydiota bacterium]
YSNDLAIISMWVHKKIYIWGSLLSLSFLFAYLAKIVTPIALIPITILFLCHYGISKDLKGWVRFCLVTVASVISFAFIFHLAVGFKNPLVADNLKMSANSMNFRWYINFDKPFIGLFTLGLYLPLIRSKMRLVKVLLESFSWSLLVILVLLGFSYKTHLIAWDVKWFSFFPIFLLTNLFLVVIPEEAFFRGFLQREITLGLNNKASNVLAILVVSLLFSSIHLLFVPSMSYFIAALLASFAYGTIFAITKSIESSIITHFMVNFIHLIFFTYPALQK